ncbi:MAG TPA: carboxylating nicotinate-nucleotide diphosphorylase, partial [Pyrinomonadaceae bacterium]|nr:carboxylating nicotinate-nucleotide diphosphorylase [Pyrinomonadaceae bacterium]
MNWLDEGSLYSQIAIFLREDLGRGDITTQSIVARNTRARGRFVAGEKMIVAGLEAAEEVFLTLDSQQQLEAFASDGEEIEAAKVIARTVGFADVLLAGERVALNLMQRLSGIATLTNQFVRAVEGTGASIVDTRQTTPGLRMLEKYAVLLGGGYNHRYGLDDGVVIRSNHAAIAGGLAAAVGRAKENLGRLHKIEVQVATEGEVREALENGADIFHFENLPAEDVARLVNQARELESGTTVQCSGMITLDNVRAYAEAGVDMIGIGSLTNSPRAME